MGGSVEEVPPSIHGSTSPTHTHTHPDTAHPRAASSSTGAAAFHVLSVSWCSDLIAAATGLPRDAITCNSLEADAETGGWPGAMRPRRLSLEGRIRGRSIHLTRLSPPIAPSTGLSTGRVLVRVDGPGGKRRHFEALTQRNTQPATATRSRPSVFIGDSVTDLLALLAADVGFVVGQSQRLRQLAAALGCAVAPLVAFPTDADVGSDGGNKKEKVLYAADDWLDVAAALYGRPVVPALLLEQADSGVPID